MITIVDRMFNNTPSAEHNTKNKLKLLNLQLKILINLKFITLFFQINNGRQNYATFGNYNLKMFQENPKSLWINLHIFSKPGCLSLAYSLIIHNEV